MLKRDKVLMGVTIGVAVLDLTLAWSTYMKKRGVVLRDMILTGIEEKLLRKKDTESGDAMEIPIE